MNPNDNIHRFFNILNKTKEPAYDVETGGILPDGKADPAAPLNWKIGYVCGYSVSDGQDAVYIPVRHAMTRGGEGNIDSPEQFELQLNKDLEKHPGKIIGQNVKFDMHFSENHGVKLGNKVKDTMVRGALLNEHKSSYSLAALCNEYPDIAQKKGAELYKHIANMVGCPPKSSSMGYFHVLSGDDPLVNEYASGDTLSTKQLYEKQAKKIYEENLDVLEGVESELTYVLQKMERRGVRVDLQEVEKMKATVEAMHLEAYSHIPMKEETLEPISLRSNKDLQEYFQWCEIDDWPFTEPTERHPDGQPSFNKDYLSTFPEGMRIIEARKFDHLEASFIKPLDSHIHKSRIHCTFNQTKGEFGGAAPGRLSCVNPNMQQVPKRDERLGKVFRKIFKPDDGFVFVEYDHSQAEPRLYSHYSGEEILIEGYKKTPFIDMHSIASQMMNVDRKVAKNLNLGMMYAMGAKKLAVKLGIPNEAAYDIVGRWHRTFTNVSSFTKKAAQVGEQRGYVRTILGRRARFPDPRWSYRAANRIIQGSSADILKYKMVQLNRWIEQNGLDDIVQILLNIHDAILVQVREDRQDLIPGIGKMFASVQEAPFNLKVPFFSDYHVGKDWCEASYGAK